MNVQVTIYKGCSSEGGLAPADDLRRTAGVQELFQELIVFGFSRLRGLYPPICRSGCGPI